MPKHEYRILFLKEFTKQLIANSKPAETIQEVHEIIEEKEQVVIPQKIIEFQKSIIEPQTRILPVPTKPRIQPVQPFLLRTRPPMMIAQQRTRYPIIPVLPGKFQPSIASEVRQEITPVPMPLPQGFNLDKINFLIQDPRVTVIECPGPGKFVLARSEGTSSITKVSLSQEEIQEIIEKFSKEAKIPVISGLFKAATGNLVITAVISDLVGSRFIITKITLRLH